MNGSRKIRVLFLALIAVTLVSLGLAGCKKDREAAPTAEEVTKEAAAAAEHPADAKPKDHPAH